jgi:hypothetical protein
MKSKTTQARVSGTLDPLVRLRHAFSFFLCRFWRHGETGRVCELPFWRTPGKGLWH